MLVFSQKGLNCTCKVSAKVFPGSELQINLNLRGDISSQGPKNVIFSCSCSTLLFDTFGPGVKISLNPRVGVFPKRPQLYILSFKRKVLVGPGVQIRLNVAGYISAQ